MIELGEHIVRYLDHLDRMLWSLSRESIGPLIEALERCRDGRHWVYLIGDGGSAANAEHIANDLHSCGIKAQALTDNSALVTCLGNDIGFDSIFSMQLACKQEAGDLLIALSGSGNSPNILRALEQAKDRGHETFAILGVGGGEAINIAGNAILVAGAKQRVAEDMQLIIAHMVTEWLRR